MEHAQAAMTIFVTGDKGFVGRETVKQLTKAGHEVFGFDLMDGYDIRDLEQLEAALKASNADRILHLAAIARFSEADANPRLAHETNVIGTLNVARAAAKYHVPVVYASTGSCYMPIELKPPITEEFPVRGNSVYGVTKTLGEKYIQEYTTHIILRYGHLYGREKRYHGLIGGFISRIERGLEPQLYGGKQSNDFCYIKDIARANLLALEVPWDSWNQVYNIGTGEEITAEAAGQAVCDVAGYTGKVNVNEGRTVDPMRFVFSTEKAERMLGFKAEWNFADGLKDMFSETKTPPDLGG